MNIHNSPTDSPNWTEINARLVDCTEDEIGGVSKQNLQKIAEILEQRWGELRTLRLKAGLVLHLRPDEVKTWDLPHAIEVEGPNIYVLGKTFLNNGAFKKVKLATSLNDLETVVHATIRLEENKQLGISAAQIERETLKEIGMHYALNGSTEFVHLLHECVYRSKQREGKPTVNKQCLIMEYCNRGDLFSAEDLVDNNFQNIMSVVKHLFKGLKVLQEKNILHRDIKMENLLLTETKEELVLKFGDLGFAEDILKEKKMLLQKGTGTACSLEYRPPEIVFGNAIKTAKKFILEGNELQQLIEKMCSPKTDVWSAGIVLYILLRGDLPEFAGNIMLSQSPTINGVNQEMINNDIEDVLTPNICLGGLDDHEEAQNFLIDMLYKMLVINQEERITGAELWEKFLEFEKKLADKFTLSKTSSGSSVRK